VNVRQVFARFAIVAGPLFGCELAGPTLPTSAENVCDGLNGAVCSEVRGSCVEGRCLIPERSYRYLLVVSLPSSSLFAPGYSFAFDGSTSSPFPFGKTAKCSDASCFTLPTLGVAEGRYDVTVATATDLGAAVGVTSGPPVTIPSRVTFRPRWLFDDGTTYDASELGLPLLPLFADPTPQPPTATARGPFNGPVQSYRAYLPPGSSYEIDAFPASAYEAALPPRAEVAVPEQATLLLGESGRSLDDSAFRTTLIARDSGPLDGFQTWLEDSVGGRRISALETLRGTSTVVTYRTLGQAPRFDVGKPTVNLVLAPPPGTITLPTLVANQVSGRVSDSVRYPQLPPPVVVAGYVGDFSKIAALSTLRFRATRIDTAESGTIGRALRYDVTVRTDDNGRYTTILPPGTYKVDVTPLADRLGLQEFDLIVPRTKLEKTFLLPPRVTVGGIARLWNGAPLAFGQVSFVPSGSYRSAKIRGEVTLPPRPAVATIGAAGGYAARLDPGTYDLVVEPAPGGVLPRTVRTGFVVPAPVDANSVAAATIPDVVIPPPTPVPFLLRDPSSKLLPRALVRAYVRQASETAYIEIAATVADDDGSATLFLGDAPTPIAPR
jgi:hypothetical protein